MERHAAIERVGPVVFARADQIVPRAGAMRDDSTGQVAGFGFEMFPYVLGAFQRKSFVDRLGTGAAGVAGCRSPAPGCSARFHKGRLLR